MATAVDRLAPAQLTRLTQLLDGPTGSELRRDPVGGAPAAPRAEHQVADAARVLRARPAPERQRDPVLKFVKQALDPARELGAGDLSETRVAVDEVLLLSGLELEPDGRLVPVRASRTADAHARAPIG